MRGAPSPINPSLAQTPRSPSRPLSPSALSPRESPRSAAAPIPASASSTHGSSMASSWWCWVCCPARLTLSHCRGDELAPVPPQQGPPVLEPDPPSPAFLHRLCRPGQTPRAEGTAEHPESPAGPKAAGNHPAGPPRHLRGVRAQDSHVKGETEAEEALGRCSRMCWQDSQSLINAMGAARRVVLDPHSPHQNPTPCGCLVPTRPPEPGVSPCPTGSGAASPAPRAGKR